MVKKFSNLTWARDSAPSASQGWDVRNHGLKLDGQGPEADQQGTARRDHQAGVYCWAREVRLAGTEPHTGTGQREYLP